MPAYTDIAMHKAAIVALVDRGDHVREVAGRPMHEN